MRALVSVSIVVKVFDETTNSVVAGSIRVSTASMSAPSTFETKWHSISGSEKARSARYAIAGPRSLPPDADVDDVADPLPCRATPLAGANPVGERRHRVEDLVHIGHDVAAVDLDHGSPRCTKRCVQHRAILRGVDVIAPRSIASPPLFDACRPGDVGQNSDGRCFDALLGQVDTEVRELQRESRCPARV